MPTELLRFATAGSVDDGKSTLIGRLLYDSQAVYEDQLAAARRVTRPGAAGALDFALLTDGLRAEREQGITIDVAYRYFSTPRRKFIIADSPGHEQYTRNMATAASNADLAVILIDARHGVLAQSRRHAYIASLLGIRHIIVAVNKMDLVEFHECVFREIAREFGDYAARLGARETLEFIPLCALEGDNVVERSARMPWYSGPSLLERLETIPLADAGASDGLRFPVQYVIRTPGFRGFAGRIAAGVLRPGDRVTALPSGRETRVRSIVTWEGELPEAAAPLSVTVCLQDEIDISRGDMLISPGRPPQTSGTFEAALVWMSERPLRAGRAYWLKHAAQTVRARVDRAIRRIDIQTLEPEAASSLALNEIGRVTVFTERPLAFDRYRENRSTGSFILIDAVTNETAAAGMIEEAAPDMRRAGRVLENERQARNGHRAAVILVDSEETGVALERNLFEMGIQTVWIPGAASDPLPAGTLASLYKLGAVVILAHLTEPPIPGAFVLSVTGGASLDLDSEARRIVMLLTIV